MPRYERTYLVEQVQVYDFVPPVGLTPESDFVAFDEVLCLNGVLAEEFTRPLDNDNIEIRELGADESD